MVGKKPTVPPSGSTSFRRHARYSSTVSTVSILGSASSPTLVPQSTIPDRSSVKATGENQVNVQSFSPSADPFSTFPLPSAERQNLDLLSKEELSDATNKGSKSI